MHSLHNLDLEEHLRNPEIKQHFITTLFDVVAPKYDRFTRVFSYGMDQKWKRELMSILASSVPADGVILDLACGTGDLAFSAASIVPKGRVAASDTSLQMIGLALKGRHHSKSGEVTFYAGDMLTIATRDESVDAVTVGYGLRNAPDYSLALEEIARVLKPRGILLTLDFYRPRNRLWRIVFLRYLQVAGNFLGWLWHREPVAYGYIARSVNHFVSWQDLNEALELRGLEVEDARPKLLGGICIHVARKKD